MVRKLIKYDFWSYLRLLLPIQIILIGIAAINRIVQIFEPQTLYSARDYLFANGGDGAYRTVFISSLVLYIVSIIVCLLMTVIVSIVRFYQGMYTNEGYLNHTLPVTPAQHIIAKMLTSLIFTLGSLLAVFISLNVITLGEVNVEVYKAFFYMIRVIGEDIGGHVALYIVEFVLLVISFCAFVYFKLYFCISVGQLVNKLKILLAFGVFFGIYIVRQIIGTVLVITVFMNSELMMDIANWIFHNRIAYFHILLCSGIFIFCLLGSIYYFVSKYIMSKKLNLS